MGISRLYMLLADAWYAFNQKTPFFSHIHVWLKYVFAIPPEATQQSTWPGEANWPLDEDNKG